jgi:hypothetical protein
VELRLDLPVGHDTIPFEDIQGFVRLAELGGAAPSDPVLGVIVPSPGRNPDSEHDTTSLDTYPVAGPDALSIEVHAPAEWTPWITIDKRLGLRTLNLLLNLRDTARNIDGSTEAHADGAADGDAAIAAKNHHAELIEITNELLRVITD